MSVVANLERPCTISESIMQSCKEVKDMREGRIPKRSLNDLFANIGSFLTALDYLYMSQPTLSRHVKVVEDESGKTMNADGSFAGESWTETDDNCQYISSQPYGFDDNDYNALEPGAKFILYSPGATGHETGRQKHFAAS